MAVIVQAVVWALGLVFLSEAVSSVAYIWTVFLALQSGVLFTVYVFLNQQVCAGSEVLHHDNNNPLFIITNMALFTCTYAFKKLGISCLCINSVYSISGTIYILEVKNFL